MTRVDGRALAKAAGPAIQAVREGLQRHGCCVITEAAAACSAWPRLLATATALHAADAEVLYPAWRGRHLTWKGFQPSSAGAESIGRALEVDPAFLTSAVRGRTFDSFEVGAPWPVADGAPSGGILDAVQLWPRIPGLDEELLELFACAHEFVLRVARTLLTSEPLAPAAIVPDFERPCSSLRLLRYEPGPESIPAHTDFELLTMIASDQPGLEVEDPRGSWRQPQVDETELVLMAGETLEMLTQGRIAATSHRVAHGAVARHSAVMFVGVDFAHELVVRSTGRRMPFGQHLEGMIVRTTPHLWERYESGELTLPYPIPEPNPFKGE